MDITPNKDGGIIKEIKREGVGIKFPCYGDLASIRYVSYLANSTESDLSDNKTKLAFCIGKGKVVKTLDLCVASMLKGEISLFTCRQDSDHHLKPDSGSQLYEIELLDFIGRDISDKKDGSIMRHRIRKGSGSETPNYGSLVKVQITCILKQKVLEEREVTFVLGEGDRVGIISGVEQALYKFKKGEECRLEISSKEAFGKEGNSDLCIPPHSDLEYCVKLIEFTNTKALWKMELPEKIMYANHFKERGTEYFKLKDFRKARRQYEKIVTFLGHDKRNDEADRLLCTAHLNLAQCYLELDDFKEVRNHCDIALTFDPNNVKALYRRAKAYIADKDYDVAIGDLETVLRADLDNKAAKKLMSLAVEGQKKITAVKKADFSRMFSKINNKSAQSSLENDQKNVFESVGEWDNEMASGMMSLEQEQAAFDDLYVTNNHHKQG